MSERHGLAPRAGRAAALGLPAIAVAALAGNLAVHELPQLPPPGALAAVLLVVPLLLRFAPTRWLAAAAVGFVWTAGAASLELERRWPTGAGQRDVEIAGWIDAFPTVSPERAVFSLRVTHAASAQVPKRVRLSWYEPPPGIAPAAHVEIVARLRSPRGFVNPGVFEYERWLFVERIGASGYVRSGEVVAGAPRALAQRWLAFRAELAERIAAAAGGAPGGALLVALTLGERHGFTEQHWTDLRRTGTSHLVAISGLHVGLIAALCFWLVRAACLRLPLAAAERAPEAAAVASAAAALVYAALAGFAVPTQRALIMVLIALAIVSSRRLIGPFNGVAAAALVVLAVEPLATLTASFWLSFAAVTLLLLLASRRVLAPPRVPRGRKVLRALGIAARLQWSITLGLAPFVVAFFGELSLAAPLVNYAAIPFFSLVMVPLCLLAAVSVWLDAAGLGLGLGLVRVAAWLAELVWQALHAAASWPWAAVQLPAAGAGLTVLAAGAAVLAMPTHPLPGRHLLWLALVPMLAARAPRPAPGAAEIVVFDVGHGLAAHVATAGHDLLYDAGPVFRSGFDTGGEIVVPALARRGVARLDMLLVSHADADHAGGTAAILAAYPQTRYLHGPDIEAPGAEACVRGQRWVWDDVTFEILHPDAEFPDRGNESSCVLKVTARGGSILLTGDIERRGERALAGNAAPAGNSALAADVVIVPHHGSATSSSPAFVAAVRPRWAIASTAHDNRWGFPRAQVRRRWEDAGATVLSTGDAGAVTIRLGDTGPPEITVQRRTAKRYWQAAPP